MKRLFLLFCLTLGITTSLVAASETVDGIEWDYTVSNGKASIGTGSYNDPAIPTSMRGAITIPASLDGYPVTSIGRYAFYDCSGLTSVTIPSSVTSIGDGAFEGCSGLTSVTIPSSVTSIGHSAFLGCSGLTSVTIPEGVTSIGHSAFLGCSGLTSVTIPEGVTSIGDYAFSGCSGLTSVTIPEGVTSIGLNAFEGCVNITKVKLPLLEESLVSGFYEACFRDKQVIDTERSIKDNVAQVCESASMLYADTTSTYTTYAYGTNMYFEGGVTYYFSVKYDDKAFLKVDDSVVIAPHSSDVQAQSGLIQFETSGWHWLELRGYNHSGPGATNNGTCSSFLWWTSVDATKRRFTLEDGKNIFSVSTTLTLSNIFGDVCANLQEVELLGSLDKIPESYCAGCTGLTAVTIPDGVTSIGGEAFYGCSGLTSVTIPSSVTSIGNNAFSGVIAETLTATHIPSGFSKGNLKTLIIPDGTTSIGDSAFRGCRGLTSVTIPEGVTSIGAYAFNGCYGLTSVVIPSSVTSIGGWAFASSNGGYGTLKKVTFLGAVPTFGERVGINGDIYYPRSRKEEWENLRILYISSDFIINGRTNWYCMGGAVKVLSILSTGVAEVKNNFYLPNETVTVTATPKEGYVFLGWSSDVAGISGVDSTLTFTMPEQEEVILVANFFPKALLEGWMDDRIDAKVDGKTLLTAAQASAATEASISQKVTEGELLTPEGAAAQTENAIQQKVTAGELITSDQLKTLALDTPVIEVKDGKATVGIQVQQASSLDGEWETVENGDIEVEITPKAGEKAAFYKFIVPTEQ